MELKHKLHAYNFDWTQYTGTPPAAQRFALMDVHRGTLVTHIAVRRAEAFVNMTSIEVGDGDNDAGFGTVTHGSTGLENLAGEYLVTQDTAGVTAAHNGKLYTDDDTIELVVTPSGAQSAGLLAIYIEYCELE